ncbi:MAG: hypothetical protein QOD70_191 [Frankiales bacterium]|nr:hypothetical protein [Frankiales bacterium]MDX6265451.1 hypothetical protein [Frankiales bacterium]
MGSLLLSVLVVALLALVVGALAAVFTAWPFVLAVDMAERRGFSPTRWGGVQLVLLGLGALLAVLALRHTGFLLLPAAVLCWVTPLVLSLLKEDEVGVGGQQGAHES